MKVKEKSYNWLLRVVKLLIICVGIIITFLNIFRKFNQGILKENILNMGANILVGIIISIFILGIGQNLEKVWDAFKQSKKGWHQYMFRVSSDYYWYTEQINAVALECNVLVDHGKMQILQGD